MLLRRSALYIRSQVRLHANLIEVALMQSRTDLAVSGILPQDFDGSPILDMEGILHRGGIVPRVSTYPGYMVATWYFLKNSAYICLHVKSFPM